jgi:SAM-dependent methyltransferase
VSLPPLTFNAWLRWDVVQRLLEPTPASVLEIGCGQGGAGARLAQVSDYLGVEPDSTSVAIARRRLAAVGRGRVEQGMVDDVVPADVQFDLVCAFEVLEHLEDDRAALAGWVRRVRPGGRLMLSTPAFASRFGPSDEMAGHYRRYDPDHMRDVLHGAGLVDVEVVVYGVPLGYALEAARNQIGRRRLAAVGTADRPTKAELTSGSGRLFQPSESLAALTRTATAPFRRLQRRFPQRGTGLVAVGTRPA